MQRTITRKADVRDVADNLIRAYLSQDHPQFWTTLNQELLIHRVKFPILEFVAQRLFDEILLDDQLPIITGLYGQPEHGSSVLMGKLLQLRLSHNLAEAFNLATEGIIQGDTWYHCDHMGERVFGHGLLTHFETALPVLTVTLQHDNFWVRRAVGVAAHYATKKGLPSPQVEAMLRLLLTEAGTKDYEVQRGVGWGLKTIAKFHPELMQTHLAALPQGAISPPIRSKIKTGLAIAAKRKPAPSEGADA